MGRRPSASDERPGDGRATPPTSALALPGLSTVVAVLTPISSPSMSRAGRRVASGNGRPTAWRSGG
ncbi:MAG: hypothetical protein AVDCRST_MAG49-4452 [uncultured Thermomicrobiales bacterium]|uniref:Uncharacterized protein n=1 Tax=uncultured Thermomicrobiales bacterium TaxID=1645740 RepID=A0A6J4VIA2_9BACT|nr:MAG: hypothetical protein AVDCRST_MAG49-4452 [uncultured Thermomicrobiales bacterium]